MILPPSESQMLGIGCDHAGMILKQALIEAFPTLQWHDVNAPNTIRQAIPPLEDYPDSAYALVHAITRNTIPSGLLICGTGTGMAIAANRFPHIRAVVCVTPTQARLARAHNDANILCLGARLIGTEVAKDCLLAFLQTPYTGEERHARRIEKLCHPPLSCPQ